MLNKSCPKMSQQKNKRSSFEVGFKLRVMQFAEEHNNSAALREFGVADSTGNIRLWCQQKES